MTVGVNNLTTKTCWPVHDHFVLDVGRAQRDFLQKKVFDCEGTLAEAKAERKESERDRKIHEAVSELKRLFPGQPAGCMLAAYPSHNLLLEAVHLTQQVTGLRLSGNVLFVQGPVMRNRE